MRTKMKTSKGIIETIIKQLEEQIGEHGENHVDLVIDTESKKAYFMYHSRHDSHPLSKDFDKLGHSVCLD